MTELGLDPPKYNEVLVKVSACGVCHTDEVARQQIIPVPLPSVFGHEDCAAVEDTGPGVPLEYRERIFERFGQIPGAAGRRRGTGLGLPFARLAAEAHGGSIWVAEGAEGGARFEIILPAGRDSSD